ncbi:MAG: DegV family EDD domain-containing protein [Gammaproteobacteria bacterium]|nr:DegV family EDD domain-containing protein [Gammaproteobacteria bacterium]
MAAETDIATEFGSFEQPARIGYLDGLRLNRALRAGIDRILAERRHLDQINVFPVPDGDTGTNLASTFGAIAQTLLARRTMHAGQLLIEVADAALDGAHGNSGVIMAQFLQGLADGLGELPRIRAADLVQAIKTSDQYARTALSEPKEGTILTVITDFGRELRQRHDKGLTDIQELMDAGLVAAQASLEATRTGLEEMRSANVVDAGASGFVSLLEGMTDFLHRGSLRAIPEPVVEDLEAEQIITAADAINDVEYRYCTECMVTGETINRRKLREALSSLGNSMVVAGTRRKIRVHIHSDQPDHVFEIARRYGTVSSQKADDMLAQTRSMRTDTARVAVVTDSAADIPEDEFESLRIHLVPLRVHFANRSYLDKISLSPEEFFDELRNNPEHPTTSQPAPGDYRRLYQFLSSHYEHVVSISVTSQVSGTWQSAVAAAARVNGQGKISVIDSRSVSLGQGLITMYAAECARAGYSGEQVVAATKKSMAVTQTFGLIPDLSYAVRGGRIRKAEKWLVDLLRVNPILVTSEDGHVKTGAVVRRRGNPVKRFARYISRRLDPSKTYRIAVGHADCADLAEQLRDALVINVNSLDAVYLTEIGSVLGAHGGPGALVAAFQEYSPP